MSTKTYLGPNKHYKPKNEITQVLKAIGKLKISV